MKWELTLKNRLLPNLQVVLPLKSAAASVLHTPLCLIIQHITFFMLLKII